MGAICILLGLIIFLGSVFGGCLIATALTSAASSALAVSPIAALGLTTVQCYAICIGICGSIGLLIGLNIFMLGLIYRKASKAAKRKSAKV